MEKCCKNCLNWCGDANDPKAACVMQATPDEENQEYYYEITKCTDSCDEFEPIEEIDDAAVGGRSSPDWPTNAIKIEYAQRQTLAHQDASGKWVLNDQMQ